MIHQARVQPVPFLRRVALRNYKSIAACDVELKPLTLIVGRNGSGKSNFLDALPDQPEGIRDAKGWLKRHMTGSRGYSEVVDQPALTAQFNLLQARERSDSFIVCYRHVERLLRRLASHAQS